MTPELRRWRVKAQLRRWALDRKPILVGPWRSEMGFEVLYWLPFLRWAMEWGKIAPDRVVVISRGGGAVLYGWPTAIDLYRLRSVEDVRLENQYDAQATGIQKQLTVTPWDADVLKEAGRQVLGRTARFHVLHPSIMYQTLAPFWEEARGMKFLQSMTDFVPLPKPKTDLGLPPRYVAMKWYSRHTFPFPHPDTGAFVQAVTQSVLQQGVPVVLLTSGVVTDDHGEILVKGPHIHTLPAVPADQQLALQAAVLGKATSYVGTYGGMAQLALRMGIPSVSWWSAYGGTAHAHLALNHWLGHATKVPFVTGSMAEAQLWRQVTSLPAVPSPGTAPVTAEGTTQGWPAAPVGPEAAAVAG